MSVPKARSRSPSPKRSLPHNYSTPAGTHTPTDNPSPRMRRNQSDPAPPLYENLHLVKVGDEMRFQIPSDQSVATDTGVNSNKSPTHQKPVGSPVATARDWSMYANSNPVNFDPNTHTDFDPGMNFNPGVRTREDSVDLPPLDPNLVCPGCKKCFRVGEIQVFRIHYQKCQS